MNGVAALGHDSANGILFTWTATLSFTRAGRLCWQMALQSTNGTLKDAPAGRTIFTDENRLLQPSTQRFFRNASALGRGFLVFFSKQKADDGELFVRELLGGRHLGRWNTADRKPLAACACCFRAQDASCLRCMPSKPANSTRRITGPVYRECG
jgi:hypothetical protein